VQHGYDVSLLSVPSEMANDCVRGNGRPQSTSYLIPLSAIEKWPAPNLTNPDRRTWLIPFTLILEVFATTTLMCRLWARVNRLAGGLRADDVSFVISTMSHTLSRELSIGGCQRSNVLREQSQRMQSI
jgi:hypothetical protein